MIDADQRMRETVIEFASCLYGGAWRERLAEVSGMPKRAVADYFQFGKALPQELSLAILRALQNDAEAQIAEKQVLCAHIKTLRATITAKPSEDETASTNEVENLKLLASTRNFPSSDTPDRTLDDAQPATRARPYIRSSRIRQRTPLRLVVSRNN